MRPLDEVKRVKMMKIETALLCGNLQHKERLGHDHGHMSTYFGIAGSRADAWFRPKEAYHQTLVLLCHK